MNLPNKLTVLRILLIPVFLVCMEFPFRTAAQYLWAFLIFAAASVTDALDGNIARSRGLVTDFGKLMDPLADKLLVMSAMICLITVDMVPAVLVIVILAREFLVTSIRLVAAGKGSVLAADGWGKIKTVFQMVWICLDLLLLYVSPTDTLRTFPSAHGGLFRGLLFLHYALLAGVVVLTVLSGLHYVVRNRRLFADA